MCGGRGEGREVCVWWWNVYLMVHVVYRWDSVMMERYHGS